MLVCLEDKSYSRHRFERKLVEISDRESLEKALSNVARYDSKISFDLVDIDEDRTLIQVRLRRGGKTLIERFVYFYEF